jgi:hypothetical protein
MSNENPTSNWGMQAVKEKFQLPEKAVITPQSESPAQLTGVKHDQGKPRMELLPPTALNEVSKVLAFGADKYGDHNWRAGLKWSRLVGASLRHTTAWISGETLDPESGLHHLAHTCCNILMLIECSYLDLGEDDRWTK